MLWLFKKKDPICGMKEEKGKGTSKYEKWFCSSSCLEQYEKQQQEQQKQGSETDKHSGCCGGM